MERNCENIHSEANARLSILALLAATLAVSCDYTVTVEDGKIKVGLPVSAPQPQTQTTSAEADVAESNNGDIIPFCKKLRGHSAPSVSPSIQGKEAEGKVVCIVDGDTFDVRLDDGRMARARLWGVDCPESSHNEKCMKNGSSNCENEMEEGKNRARKVRQILSKNRRITLEPPYKNNGNRLLAYARLQNGVDLGRKLISDCLCESEYDHKRKKDYQKAAHNCSR